MLDDFCSVEKIIYLKEVLKQMKKLDKHKEPIPFDIVVREFNKQNKSAGKLKEYNECKLMQKGRFRKYVKNPNHWENRTRNVKLPNGDIKTIHTIFIVKFNGKKVVF